MNQLEIDIYKGKIGKLTGTFLCLQAKSVYFSIRNFIQVWPRPNQIDYLQAST